MATSIYQFGKKRIKFFYSLLVSIGEENISWDLKVFSSLPWFGHSKTDITILSMGEPSAWVSIGNVRRESQRPELEQWHKYCYHTHMGQTAILQTFPCRLTISFAKSEPFLHNIKLSQQRWPGQHLIFSLPATISEKG